MAATVRPMRAMGEPRRTESLPGTVVGEVVAPVVEETPVCLLVNLVLKRTRMETYECWRGCWWQQ